MAQAMARDERQTAHSAGTTKERQTLLKSDLKRIVDEAVARGWVKVPGKKHDKYRFGETGPIVTVGNTLSDRRALLNVEARFRRVERTGSAK